MISKWRELDEKTGGLLVIYIFILLIIAAMLVINSQHETVKLTGTVVSVSKNKECGLFVRKCRPVLVELVDIKTTPYFQLLDFSFRIEREDVFPREGETLTLSCLLRNKGKITDELYECTIERQY